MPDGAPRSREPSVGAPLVVHRAVRLRRAVRPGQYAGRAAPPILVPVSVVDEVRERTDILALVGASTPPRKAGRLYKGLCPFHNEDTPSFVVYPDSGRWHCFGACATGGDAYVLLPRGG